MVQFVAKQLVLKLLSTCVSDTNYIAINIKQKSSDHHTAELSKPHEQDIRHE